MNGFVSPTEERNFAMFCHLGGLAMFVLPFGNIILPLILWSLRKDQSTLVDREGKKAINFQISMTIYFMVSMILVFIFVGIFLLLILGLLNVIFTIVAAVKTANQEPYDYLLSITFLN
jgi:uncharacterized Tic20 family protein